MRALPVTWGDERGAFRQAAISALGASGIEWRFLCAISDMGAMGATLQADLAVAPLMSQTVSSDFNILDDSSGLPRLPTFFVNLFRAPASAGTIAGKLADDISESFTLRYPQAA